VKKASGKAQIRSNSGLLREFATPQGVFLHGRVRPHELISASLDGARGIGVAQDGGVDNPIVGSQTGTHARHVVVLDGRRPSE